jgi:hypothetical protein
VKSADSMAERFPAASIAPASTVTVLDTDIGERYG